MAKKQKENVLAGFSRRNATITDTGTEIHIEIPSRKNGAMRLFALIWVAIWLIIIPVQVFEMFYRQDFSNLVYLTIFLIAGFAMLYAIFWGIYGKEVITFSRDKLKVQKKMLGFSWARVFERSKVKNFRITEEEERGVLTAFCRVVEWRDLMGIGKIIFDYGDDPDFGDEIIRFGHGMDKEEAQYILDVLFKKKYIRFVTFR